MRRPATIQTLLDDAIETRIFSGYQLYAERRGETLALHGGMLSYWGDPMPVTAKSRFDIGSVTKAVATASLLGLLLQDKTLTLDDPVEKFLPELAGTPLGGRTVGALASHSSGLIGWYAIYDETDRAGLLPWLRKRMPDLVVRGPGEKAEYSDVGFIVLGLVLERAARAPIAELFQKRVVSPLGASETEYGPLLLPGEKKAGLEIVATEYCLIRKRVLQGEIFDENCHFLGGKTGHAGLFATARGIAPICREWLLAARGKSKWLSGEIAGLLTRPSGRAPGSTWGYGWDTPSKTGSTAGDRFSRKSFGHLGYPGCSVWIDPENETFAVFFTNRIHPSRYDERIRQVRPALHDAVYSHFSGG